MINVDFENNKITVSDDILKKLKYLIKKEKKYNIGLTEDINNELKISVFEEIMSKIIHTFEIHLDYLPSENNEIKYNTDYLYQLAKDYDKLDLKYIFDIGLEHYQRFSNDNKINNIHQIIEIMYEIENEIFKYYLTENLINAKEDIIKDMRYFLDEDFINRFNIEYEDAIKNHDTDKMNTMLVTIQDMILKEWENLYSDLDSMTDDNFCFIGHSTCISVFKGDFYSKKVSASLFNKELTDTYKLGYGFIFAPKNIIGANSSDMYVDNYADDSESMLNYSIIKKIAHPKRVLDETMKHKETNIKNNDNRIVYNEVILDCFEPIGIFCFTDGSKNYNYNHREAHLLQKSFSNLKIYEFDTMKNKTGASLIESQLQLINKLTQLENNSRYEIKEEELYQYQMFLDKYNKLKEKDNYKEDDIKDIFNENIRLLSFFDTTPDKLFSKMYTDEQIKYILLKNYRYNIELILNGKANSHMLENLKDLYPYKDKLNKYFDGLSELLELINKLTITDEIMEEVNKIESLNFYDLIKAMIVPLINDNNNKKVVLKNEIDNYKKEYEKLNNELVERQNKEQEYQYCQEIYLNRFWHDMIISDYNNVIMEISGSEQEETKFKKELSRVQKELESINKRIESENNLDYKNDSKYYQLEQKILELSLNLEELKKHPFMNRKKIKDLKIIIHKLKNEQTINKIDFETNKTDKLNELNVQKKELESRILNLTLNLEKILNNKNKFKTELDNINNKIKKYFKCDTIEQIEKMINYAEKVVEEYDVMNKYYITNLIEQLKKLSTMIDTKEQSILVMQNENDNLSKLRIG